MIRRNDRLNAVALAAAILCLLPLHLLKASGEADAEPQSGGCGQSMSSLEHLNGNIGMDSGIAGRAQSLADSALQNAQPPSPAQVQQLAEDSMESLQSAGDQIDQVAEQIGQRLQTPSLARQGRAWNRGVSDMRTARSGLRTAIGRAPDFARQRIGSLSATGVGPKVVYEAAETFQQSVESLGQIAIDSGFQQMGMSGAVLHGARDTPPPPNPSPDPWQELMRRLRAQQALSRSAARGLGSAQALQAQQFQQARQLATQMKEAVQQATDMANQLGQLLGPCTTANQSNSSNNQPRADPPAQSTPAPAAQTAAAAASGGGMGAGTAMLGLAAAGAAGYYAYTQLDTCAEPDLTANTNTCIAGNCGGCSALLDQVQTFCDCIDQKHPGELPAGTCGQFRDDVRRWNNEFCSNPAVAVEDAAHR